MAIISGQPYNPIRPSPGTMGPGGVQQSPVTGQPSAGAPLPGQLGSGAGYATPGGGSLFGSSAAPQSPQIQRRPALRSFTQYKGNFGTYSRFGSNPGFYQRYGGGQPYQSSPYAGVQSFSGKGGGWPFQWQSAPFNFLSQGSPQ